ncbi:uncharacterized protein LOC120283615 [Dioscorea cayenensis subsp. rotundata]|uniref:Uncharacterized protein LOC120283615 n=1 Tax=Dioscorea cayennensis subsp. rotundata TaxID=55577 RepID=A0AB40D618_DIOCR|nr:uncharacterized protein LOC120283615 [Dioscorea cayenensis subsp. rotundata]
MALCNKSLLLLHITILISSTCSVQEGKDPRDIDKIIRDYAFGSFGHHRRTAVLYTVPMPPSLSSVSTHIVRYRSGSLWKHGAKIKEFLIQPGTVLHPHSKRILVIHENFGNLSYTCFNHMNVHGYQLVSPVLGLLIYNASKVSRRRTSNESLIEVMITKKPIRIDFSSVMTFQGPQSLCVLVGLDGKLSVLNKVSHNVCVAWRQGHFALVVPKSEVKDGGTNGGEAVKLSKWRLVMVCSATAVLAAVLMVLIIVAVVSVRKRRFQVTEMERRAYEDEALQVSMVDHVRAPTATVSRTSPVIETEYEPPLQ